MPWPITELRNVLPPPVSPDEGGASIREWNAVFRSLATRLPEDYVQYVNHYGTGTLCNFFMVYNPFAASEGFNLLKNWTAILSSMASLRADPESGEELVPFPLYFEPGGLLPWGRTINGEDLFWRTRGDPDKWTVVVIGRACGVEVFDVSMSEFLRQILSQSLRPRFLPPAVCSTPAFRRLSAG